MFTARLNEPANLGRGLKTRTGADAAQIRAAQAACSAVWTGAGEAAHEDVGGRSRARPR